MLDASSTAAYIARGLRKKKKLTVITNSVEIIIELFDVPEWNVISTGGVSRERSFGLVGPRTNQMINYYHVDKAFISCKGLTMEAGLTDSDEQDADSKRAMLRAANEKILVVDSSKFGKSAFTRTTGLDDIDKVVTDKRPSAQWMREFERLGIECIYPDRKN